MNSKLFVGGDVSLNSNLFVGTKSIMVGDVSMNSKLSVGDDVSMNSKLSVGGDVSLNRSLYIENNLHMNNNYALYAKNSSGTADDAVFTPRGGDNATYLNFGTNGFYIRNNASANTMFMGSTGYVGIGTISPASVLDVSGNARIRGKTIFGMDNPGPGGGGGDTAYMEYIGIGTTGESTCLKIVCANDSDDNIALMPSGNVGIGTTVPKSKLDVNGGVIIGANYAGVQNGFANGLLVEGAIGIGTNSVGTYKLNVNGDVQAFSYNATSDIRLKTNIQSLSGSLELINQLNGVSFTWKNDTTNKPVLGLIAQEVEKVLPDIVNTAATDNEDGYKQKSIHYDGLFPHLVESIKTLTQENKALVSKVDVLTQENKALSAKVDHIMSILDKLNISV